MQPPQSHHPLAIIAFIVALSTTFGIALVTFAPAPNVILVDKESLLPTATSTVQHQSEVTVTSPLPNAIVTSPLTITGRAPGYWFFEATFPITIKDTLGRLLGQGTARAESEWMTNAQVPFSASITFATPTSATGTVILSKDNPSGLSENGKDFIIPVIFSQESSSSASTRMQIFLVGTTTDTIRNCLEVVPITRNIPHTLGKAQIALEELLLGPTAEEQSNGLSSMIVPGVHIRHLTITKGVAHVDFSAEMERGIEEPRCQVETIRKQIEQTLVQFPTITSVVISIDGKEGALVE